MQRESMLLDAMPSVTLRASNVVSYALFILVNVLSNLGLLGPSNAEVSKLYNTPLTPAGWAFSIWGLIFGLQGAAVIYAALPRGYDSPAKRAAVNTIGYGWQLTWLFECSWQLLFPLQTRVSFVVCALLLFAGLSAIASTLARVYRLVPLCTPPTTSSATLSPLMFALFALPTSINTAWLSVASCLGVTVLASSQGVSASYQNLLSACLAAVVSTCAVWIVLQYKDIAYGLTLIWALSAVIQKQQRVEVVTQLSVVAIVVLAGSCVVVVVRWWKLRSQQVAERGRGDGGAAAAAALQETLLATGSGTAGTTLGSSSA